jgi:hypothetical protein
MRRRPKGKLFLFQWHRDSAAQRAAELTADGWEVTFEFEDGARGGKAALDLQPHVIVFDLAKRPSHSYATAEGIRGYKAGRALKIVFVDGADEVIAKTKKKVNDGVYTTSAGLLKSLSQFA